MNWIKNPKFKFKVDFFTLFIVKKKTLSSVSCILCRGKMCFHQNGAAFPFQISEWKNDNFYKIYQCNAEMNGKVLEFHQ